MKYVDVLGAKIVINEYAAKEIVQSLSPNYQHCINFIADTIKEPQEIWLAKFDNSPIMRTYIKAYVMDDEGDTLVAVAIYHFNEAHENWFFVDADILINSELSDFQNRVNSYRKHKLCYRAENNQ